MVITGIREEGTRWKVSWGRPEGSPEAREKERGRKTGRAKNTP